MSGLTEKLRRVYVPMTDRIYSLCLQKERHGYSITLKSQELTDGQLFISPEPCMEPVQNGKVTV